LAGTHHTIVYGATFFVTTAHDAMTAFFHIIHGHIIVTLLQTRTHFSIIISHPSLGKLFLSP